MRVQVDAMAERLAVLKKRAAAAEASKQKSKGKGKGKGAGKGKGRHISGDTTESDTDSDSRSKGAKGYSSKFSQDKNICWNWQKHGQCWKKDCPWKHEGGGLVLVMDRLEELSQRFSTMQGDVGGVTSRVGGRDPKVTLKPQHPPRVSMREMQSKVMVTVAPQILMNDMRLWATCCARVPRVVLWYQCAVFITRSRQISNPKFEFESDPNSYQNYHALDFHFFQPITSSPNIPFSQHQY